MYSSTQGSAGIVFSVYTNFLWAKNDIVEVRVTENYLSLIPVRHTPVSSRLPVRRRLHSQLESSGV